MAPFAKLNRSSTIRTGPKFKCIEDQLWTFHDEISEISELEKQAVLLSSELGQQQLVVALLAGEAWGQALELLRQSPVELNKKNGSKRTRALFGEYRLSHRLFGLIRRPQPQLHGRCSCH